jgi:NodT family efflux transporter outer membrane factor (OMF) lipoprotein
LTIRTCAALLAASVLGACAVNSELPSTQTSSVATPPAWYAPPLAHQGRSASLTQWWARLDDPVLTRWIALAQAESPSIAAARARVFDARAQLQGEQTASGPQLAAVGSASRSRQVLGQPAATAFGAGVQASWALDLWGGASAGIAAAQALQDAAGAGWHEARVLVAAELASLYYAQRQCQAQLAVAQEDRDSRAATAQAAGETERAGLTAPAVAALARASAAEAASRTRAQQQRCEQQIKSLVSLTGLAEPELRAQLAQAPAVPADAALNDWLSVDAVPAAVIRQRPDVYRAQRELVAAAESVGVARAALLPSLSLSGSLLRNRVSSAGASDSFNSWSVGPFALSLPLLGRGALQAGVDSAQARYESAAVAYAATLRNAVAEVERSLVALASLREQAGTTQTALDGYSQSFTATQARYRVGLSNLNELEEARRLQLNASSSAVTLQQDRIQAWIDLYVALGGGFDPARVADSLQHNAAKDPS